MPVEFGLWRIDESPRRIDSTKLDREDRIEELVISDPAVLETDLLILDHQVRTDDGKLIDVLGINEEGDLHIVEIKRNRTPREVVAQGLEYASWVRTLGYDDITNIFENRVDDTEFESAFAEQFDTDPPEELNRNHSLTIVASELDSSTERIVQYLSEEYAVPVNALLFSYYEDDGREYIGRTWLTNPHKPRERTNKKEPWNGRDFYVIFDDRGESRSWTDGQKHGFVAAGQGRKYSKRLEKLQPGNRVFAYVPESGYVGVGTVTDEAVPVTDFVIRSDGEEVSILENSLEAEHMGRNRDDPEMCEYLVRVDWSDTVDKENAVWETGMFSNQNIVCKLRNQFTIERLTDAFDIDDS